MNHSNNECIRCGAIDTSMGNGVTCSICIDAIAKGTELMGADRTGYQVPPTLTHQPAGWESVETAPKDEVVLLSWWDHHGKQWEYEAGLYGSTRGGWLHGQATYWKRISAPAALKSEGRK